MCEVQIPLFDYLYVIDWRKASLILLKEKALVRQEGNISGPIVRVADTCVDKFPPLSDIY